MEANASNDVDASQCIITPGMVCFYGYTDYIMSLNVEVICVTLTHIPAAQSKPFKVNYQLKDTTIPYWNNSREFQGKS